MRPVVVLILLPPRSAPPGTPLGWLESAREMSAEGHRAGFAGPGVDVRIVRDAPDARSFGQRLRDLAAAAATSGSGRRVGLIVLGGGSMPLARADDRAAFVAAARARSVRALANNAYSADAVAVSDARVLLGVPDLPADNALPRWLAEGAGIPVADLRRRPHLAFDIDSPVDLLLLGRDPGGAGGFDVLAGEIAAAATDVEARLEGVAVTIRNRRAELLVAGRTSSRVLGWLERNAACRVRALVEERGLKASTGLATGAEPIPDDPGSPPAASRPAPVRFRPPRSVLGMVLDGRGPDAFGTILAELADAAVVDSRVLLAHRLGPDESGWPSLPDRLSSDLLQPAGIADPWLRALTESALRAPIPVLLGGHTLAGPGLPLLGGGAAGAGSRDPR